MGEAIELTVGKPAHGGYCVARLDGRVILVRHTAPGERVLARVSAKRSKLWYADAVEILEPSPDRRPHIWPQAGPNGVGGAELGHLELAAQRTWKSQIISEALAHHAQWLDPVAVQQPGDDTTGLGMRTRTRLIADGAGQLGMYRHRSKTVLPLTSLPLVDSAITDLGILQRRWKPGTQVLGVAGADGALALEVGARRRIRYQVPTEFGHLEYSALMHGFWQGHRYAPSTLISAVLTHAELNQGEVVWDLFSGAGLLTVPAALATGATGHVHAVEADEAGVSAAKRNFHPYPTITLHASTVAQALADLPKPDVIIADPPRTGMGLKLMEQLCNSGARKIVYVACDPIALARDAGQAQKLGWKLTKVEGFDLFPHTHHLEAVATLIPEAR